VIVLDASAVLALLLKEPGARRVEDELPDSAISAATLTEIITKAMKRGITSDAAYSAVVDWGIQIVPVDTTQARIAAEISKAPKELDLSMGDRLCIALAIAQRAKLMTSDGGILQLDAGILFVRFR
jgi:PIN domain nuclease of toxin-antitoxin system